MKTTCHLMGISRSTYYFWQSIKEVSEPRTRKQYAASHVMSETERASVISLMLSEEYMDKTPYEIFFNELDRGNQPDIYCCTHRGISLLLLR
ncbi:hypothetical protein KJ656_07630 [bacterium]|nr:hypothetical protein [bacterium]